MKLLSEERMNYIKSEIIHYTESISELESSGSTDSLTLKMIDRNKALIQEREDQLLVMKAIHSINIEHCESVGIDVADLVKAIRRITL